MQPRRGQVCSTVHYASPVGQLRRLFVYKRRPGSWDQFSDAEHLAHSQLIDHVDSRRELRPQTEARQCVYDAISIRR